MTRTQTPPWERRQNEHEQAPPTEYTVTFPDGTKTTVDNADLADQYARRTDATVGPAKTGWE